MINDDNIRHAQRVLYGVLKRVKQKANHTFDLEFPVIRLPLVGYEVFYGFTSTSKEFLCLLFGVGGKSAKRWLSLLNSMAHAISVARDYGVNGCCLVNVDSIFYIVLEASPLFNNSVNHVVVCNEKINNISDDLRLHVLPLETFIEICYR